MKTIITPEGEVVLHSAPAEVRSSIRSLWPFGAFRFAQPTKGAEYGLVMQCGQREIAAVKQQPPDCDRQSGMQIYSINSLLIAHSLAAFRKQEFQGLFFPCPYMRDKGTDCIESGIAYFSFPRDLEGPPQLCHSPRILAFIQALRQSSEQTGLPLQEFIGLEERPRSQLGSIGMGFMVVGKDVVCLKTVIEEEDPVWLALRITGIVEMFHLPSVPAVIEEHELPNAKGEINT